MILTTYYRKSSTHARQEKKDTLLAFLYALFESEVPREDYSKAIVMLQEYKSTVTAEIFENGDKQPGSITK